MQEEGAPAQRLVLIHNGVDTARFRPVAAGERERLRRERNIDVDSLVLLVVANLIPYKGHADLLNALSAISGRMPADWQLLLVGRDDGIGSSLVAQARQLGISGQVHLLGPRDDIAALMQLADIGILPSHQEGFSNTLLESMACGLPMVATTVGGNPEAIGEGVTGFLVPPHDPERLGAAILQLAGDPALRRRLSEAARHRCKREFSLETCVTAYLVLYSRLLAGQP